MSFIILYIIVGTFLLLLDAIFFKFSRESYLEYPLVIPFQILRWPIAVFNRIKYWRSLASRRFSELDKSGYRRWLSVKVPEAESSDTISTDSLLAGLILVALEFEYETAYRDFSELMFKDGKAPEDADEDLVTFECTCYLLHMLNRWSIHHCPDARVTVVSSLTSAFISTSAVVLSWDRASVSDILRARLLLYNSSPTEHTNWEYLTDYITHAILKNTLLGKEQPNLILESDRIGIHLVALAWTEAMIPAAVTMMENFIKQGSTE